MRAPFPDGSFPCADLKGANRCERDERRDPITPDRHHLQVSKTSQGDTQWHGRAYARPPGLSPTLRLQRHGQTSQPSLAASQPFNFIGGKGIPIGVFGLRETNGAPQDDTHRRSHRQPDRHHEQTNRQTDKRTDRQKPDGRTSQTDTKQTNRQAHLGFELGDAILVGSVLRLVGIGRDSHPSRTCPLTRRRAHRDRRRRPGREQESMVREKRMSNLQTDLQTDTHKDTDRQTLSNVQKTVPKARRPLHGRHRVGQRCARVANRH